MNIVKVIGGLGNQMFQYAFYKAMRLNSEHDTKLEIEDFKTYNLHNGYELQNVFKIDDIQYANKDQIDTLKDGWPSFRIRRKLGLLKSTHYNEYFRFSYDPNLYNMNNTYFDGYWQNIQYIKDAEKEIRKDFIFSEPDDRDNLNILEKIRNTNSCSIHIRRGDYMNHPTYRGICEDEYYINAISYIESIYDDIHFFVFSNDINWCKEFLTGNKFIFIDWNHGNLSYIDMFLMQECNHNIISNSTFSWWSSWLNDYDRKIVITPSKWTNKYNNNNLLLDEWVKID